MIRALYIAAAALAALVLGCVPAPLDLTNRRCPCTAGWTCDTAHDRCVLAVVSDASAGDAAPDAFSTDAFRADAFATDAFAGHDGGSDASRPIDGGHDAFIADAFTPADGGPDAGHDSGMPGDTGCTGALASALVCDGFETDPGPWTGRTEHSGTVVTDGTRAARGTRSLHAQTTANGGQASRQYDGLGPFTSGDIWIRISLYLPSTATPVDHTWFSIGESAPPYAGISLGMGATNAGSYSTISMTYVSNGSLVVPRDTWTCWELHITVSDTVGVIEVYENGVLGVSRSGLDTNPGAGFSGFSVGVDYSGATQGPIEVWIDEVALSRARLPCP